MTYQPNATVKHKHHIIPRYMGGSNDISNIIEVSITQHAMWHFCNYQLFENWEDYLAYKALSGHIGKEEANQYLIKKASEKGVKVFQDKMRDEGFKVKFSEKIKSRYKDSDYRNKMAEHCRKIQSAAVEASKTPEAKEKHKRSLRAIGHQKGEKNSQYGKRWVHSLELKVSKRIWKNEDLPGGWLEGRIINFDKKTRCNLPIKGVKSGVLRTWKHKEHGVISDVTSVELVDKFKNMRLNLGALSQVALGRNNHHKGWRLVEASDGYKSYRGKKRNWYHPVHGAFKGFSAKELIEMFPNQNLRIDSLYKINKSTNKSYKGWKMLIEILR